MIDSPDLYSRYSINFFQFKQLLQFFYTKINDFSVVLTLPNDRLYSIPTIILPHLYQDQ